MRACSRVGCAMCSSSSTDHLTTWLIPLGGPKSGPSLLRVFYISCPLSEPFGNKRNGAGNLPAGEEPCIPGTCPQWWGVSLCHGGTLKGVQRLSPCNLPVTGNHFRCQTRFVSLGRDDPASLARTKTKSGFKMTLLAVGVGKVSPLKPRACAGLPYACLGAPSWTMPGAGSG